MKTHPHSRLISLFAMMALMFSACLPVFPAPSATLIPQARPTTTTQPTPRAPTPAAPPTASPSPLPTASQTASPLPPSVSRRVLIISIDGLRPDAISLAPMPNLQILMRTGAYSLTAQTVFPSATLPSHASMLTGLCPSKNGVDWNDYLPERGYAIGVDLFDLAHAAGLKTVMYVGKKKLVQITEPASVDIFRYINDRDVVIAERITEEFPIDFGLMFVHFATPDAMGHAHGWLTLEYLSVVRRADEALGTLLKDLDDYGLRQDTLIIVTADHGGHEQTHGLHIPEDMSIPWVISGPGVHPGQLTTPIQTTDTAATAAWALDLPRPAEWDGWPIFEAFGQLSLPRPLPFCK